MRKEKKNILKKFLYTPIPQEYKDLDRECVKLKDLSNDLMYC